MMGRIVYRCPHPLAVKLSTWHTHQTAVLVSSCSIQMLSIGPPGFVLSWSGGNLPQSSTDQRDYNPVTVSELDCIHLIPQNLSKISSRREMMLLCRNVISPNTNCRYLMCISSLTFIYAVSRCFPCPLIQWTSGSFINDCPL